MSKVINAVASHKPVLVSWTWYHFKGILFKFGTNIGQGSGSLWSCKCDMSKMPEWNSRQKPFDHKSQIHLLIIKQFHSHFYKDLRPKSRKSTSQCHRNVLWKPGPGHFLNTEALEGETVTPTDFHIFLMRLCIRTLRCTELTKLCPK